MRPFLPFFRNPHLSTLAGNFWPRAIDEARFPTRVVRYRTDPQTQIVVEENRPAGEARGEVLLHHGLEGSSKSGYLVSLAQELLQAGYAVHRMNMRSCGGTEELTNTLYHSGLTGDVRAILGEWAAAGRGPRFLGGFSLGGNVTLKMAGELGEAARELVAGVIAVSTPIDLAACVDRLGARENFLYQQKFVRSLRARYRRRHAAAPQLFPARPVEQIRTVREFDDMITAPAFGFGDAANYYRTQSSYRFLGGIRVPALLIQAKDDPMIPFGLFESAAVRANGWIELVAAEHGGHLGFIARERPRFWIDGIIRDWLGRERNNHPGSTV